MEDILDNLSLAFGRRLWVPFRWFLSLAWWTVFAAAILSVWPHGYLTGNDILSESGIGIRFPASEIILPVFALFSFAQTFHHLAIERRDSLLSK
jgi:hypothetical protein